MKIITLILTSVFSGFNILVKILKDRIDMADCIRGLLINCSHLKELFIVSNITYNYQTYLKIEKIFLNISY